ncbi:hypothetical protein [Bradyrhizobium sp. I1.7.5]|uniref:hypothetical protein n=1 Tax=Bradyrhizobium sp. I1.7.5 TaxID=3156363 RepID=UPI0033984CF9
MLLLNDEASVNVSVTRPESMLGIGKLPGYARMIFFELLPLQRSAIECCREHLRRKPVVVIRHWKLVMAKSYSDERVRARLSARANMWPPSLFQVIVPPGHRHAGPIANLFNVFTQRERKNV